MSKMLTFYFPGLTLKPVPENKKVNVSVNVLLYFFVLSHHRITRRRTGTHTHTHTHAYTLPKSGRLYVQ